MEADYLTSLIQPDRFRWTIDWDRSQLIEYYNEIKKKSENIDRRTACLRNRVFRDK